MTNKISRYVPYIGFLCMVLFVAYLIQGGYLFDEQKMQNLIQNLGILGPIFFIFLQIVQVVIPILPGGVSSGIGVIIFGSIKGFIYNYVGLMIGAIIVFLLVKKYGKTFILKFVKEKTYNKYIQWLNREKRFDYLFAIAIFLPGLPDDLICMIAGLSNMSLQKYVFINLLCKPFALVAYSWGMQEIIEYISHFI